MMKTYLKRAFQLSDSGVKGLAKSIWSFFLYYVSFVPPMICVFLFADRLLNGNTGKPVVYLLFMLAATLVMYLVINYNYKTTYDETYQESANLRIDLAEQLSKLPLSYFSKHNLSDLAQTIMADVASIEHAFANAVANSIGFAIYFLVISVALLIMNWKLGLCVLLPVLTSASVLFLTKKLQVRDVNKHYDKLRDISESFQNAIELNQEIKSYGLKEKVEAQMDQQLDESENLQWKAQITQTIPVTIGQTLSILPIGITATVGLSMLASGQVSILILLGYIIMAAKLSGAMGGVLLYLTEIFYLDARIARIGEIKNHELQGGEKAVLSDFNVEIKDVCFSYQKDTQVIRHASFTAEQGQVTALVGPSGCGKTTMLKLISRLYDADSGTVQIGGTDIREIHTDSLFKYVSIVFQEVILFNTSIMENIRLGRLDASDEEVIRAAKLAGCNEFVTDNLVSEISFAIKEGESLILLGQSGSGKTMTCSAVLNLLDPKKFKVSGSIFFGETDLLNSSEKQRRGIYGNQIVYIPQNPMTALDPSMRIGRQMDETLRLHSDKSRQQRYNYILRLLHDVGLDDPDRVYRAYPHMLSGGMLQRVIIAMAMMLDAKFVLADEPTTALDVIHRNGIIDLFSQMKANGVGIFMVTHDFATALQLGGNMLVMKEGKIIESGEVQSVFDHTTEPYTRSLIEAYSLSCAFTKGAES